MASNREVLIQLKNGAEYKVKESDLDRVKVGPKGETYKDLGAKVLRWADGEPYKKTPEPKEEKPA